LSSNALTPAVKKEVLARAVAIGQQQVAALPASLGKDVDIHQHDWYFESLGQLLLLAEPSDAVKGIFSGLRRHPTLEETRMVTTEFYLKNNLTLAPADLESMASDPYYRIELFTLLKKFGQEKLYPAKYLSQEKFAEGALHRSLMSDDDGIPEQIKLVGVRSVRYKGQKQNLYVYQYQYEGDNTWRIAFSGPFPEKVKYVTETGDYTFATSTEYTKGVDLASVITEITEGEVELLK
jgi:hypothetical protein